MLATVGESAHFEIELSKGDAKTKWFKNNVELDVSSTSRYRLEIDGKTQRLAIDKVDLSDSGDYSCTIARTRRTCRGSLTVEEPKVSFVTRPPATIIGDYRKDVEIEVELSRDNVHVQWLK